MICVSIEISNFTNQVGLFSALPPFPMKEFDNLVLIWPLSAVVYAKLCALHGRKHERPMIII
jgi:hypothetical protein